MHLRFTPSPASWTGACCHPFHVTIIFLFLSFMPPAPSALEAELEAEGSEATRPEKRGKDRGVSDDGAVLEATLSGGTRRPNTAEETCPGWAAQQ